VKRNGGKSKGVFEDLTGFIVPCVSCRTPFELPTELVKEFRENRAALVTILSAEHVNLHFEPSDPIILHRMGMLCPTCLLRIPAAASFRA
jgi:hypothetical protein